MHILIKWRNDQIKFPQIKWKEETCICPKMICQSEPVACIVKDVGGTLFRVTSWFLCLQRWSCHSYFVNRKRGKISGGGWGLCEKMKEIEKWGQVFQGTKEICASEWWMISIPCWTNNDCHWFCTNISDEYPMTSMFFLSKEYTQLF